MNAGDLSGQTSGGPSPTGVRVAVVAGKSGNADGAKGGREVNASSEGDGERRPSGVPGTDKQEGEDLWQRYGAERGIWSEKMLVALDEGVRGNKWFSLVDKVYADRTLERAWEKVRSHAGGCGVDGITVDHFAKDSRNRLLAVKEHLKAGTYQPKSVKRVWIPKPGKAEPRPLGVPTVRDRVVQGALKMVLEPIFEREFAPRSYGFRPGRSGHDALREVERQLRSGQIHVVDIDIQGYFDSIPHPRMMARLTERVADGRVLDLIESFLQQDIMEESRRWQPEAGTPQGAVLSPLLANLYLNPLDWKMAAAGICMVRYADDMVALCRDAETATRTLHEIKAWMDQEGLTLHPQKTRIVDMGSPGEHFDFLGYRFWRGQQGNLRRFIRPSSRKKLRERVKPLTRRANGHSMSALVNQLNPILRGFYGYFKHAHSEALQEVDGWVRNRLRGILRKRKHLRGRARGQDYQRWPNCYFADLGLFCLAQAQRSEIASLRKGVKY